MKKDYIELMGGEHDITLVEYLAFLLDMLKNGGIKVWTSTLLMHLVRLITTTAVMVYYGNFPMMDALSYGILVVLAIIPLEVVFAWKMSIFIKHRTRNRLSKM